jgi:hypothetical protein
LAQDLTLLRSADGTWAAQWQQPQKQQPQQQWQQSQQQQLQQPQQQPWQQSQQHWETLQQQWHAVGFPRKEVVLQPQRLQQQSHKQPRLGSGMFTADLSMEATDVLHVKILGRAGMFVSWQEALAELSKPGHSDFRNLLTRVLGKAAPFKAYFWECAPVSRELLQSHAAFEFALIDAPGLARNHADITDFEEYLENVRGQPVMKVFQNPGRDTSLVAPAQATCDPEDYTHISAFFNGKAPLSQKDAAWQALGDAISNELRTRDVVWVSTDGRGVHWMHFRVDSRPKYFKMTRYRDAQFGLRNIR